MALFENITEPTKIDVLVGFFDLTGFLQIAESLDSLELIDLLDGDFQLTGDILEETGGMLIKTIGDWASRCIRRKRRIRACRGSSA